MTDDCKSLNLSKSDNDEKIVTWMYNSDVKEEINNKNRYIVSKEEGLLIFYSSFLFMLPALLAYNLKLYFHFYFLPVTSIISANYWRDPKFSWRRDIDLIFSKISFITYFYLGLLHIRQPSYIMICCPLVAIMVWLYYKSHRHSLEKKSNWRCYHFISHVAMTIVQFLIVLSENNHNHNYRYRSCIETLGDFKYIYDSIFVVDYTEGIDYYWLIMLPHYSIVCMMCFLMGNVGLNMYRTPPPYCITTLIDVNNNEYDDGHDHDRDDFDFEHNCDNGDFRVFLSSEESHGVPFPVDIDPYMKSKMVVGL